MLKRERVNRRRYLTVADARSDVFDYIERFHNPRIQRRLDSLDRGVEPVRARSLQSRRARGRRRQVTELRRGVPVQSTSDRVTPSVCP